MELFLKKQQKMITSQIKKILLLILIILVTGCNVNVEPVNKEDEYISELEILGYSKEEIEYFETNFTEDTINLLTEYDYVENIMSIIENEQFDITKIKEYLDSYQVTNNINHSFLIVNNNIKYTYNEKLVNILDHKYFMINNLDRYMSYESEDIDTVITTINCNLDKEFYTNVKETDTSKGKLMIVNKNNKLSDKYKNSNMVKMNKKYSNNTSSYLDKEAYENFKNMVDTANKSKIYFINTSSYRSYSRQKTLYENYLNNKGEEYANKWSAKPGHSEHQTGLALDVVVKGESSFDGFENTKEYEWLKDNAHNYGFILRYPKGKSNITGYAFEPWHYRYVGVEVATYIYQNNITFEEYYAYFIENK